MILAWRIDCFAIRWYHLKHPFSGFGLVAAKYAPEERGTPIGLLSSIMTFAPSLGILAGGMSTRFISWRVLFWAPLGIGLVLLGVACMILRARGAQSTTTVSYPDPRAFADKPSEATYQVLASEEDDVVQPQTLPRTQSHAQVQQQQQPQALPSVSSSLEAVVGTHEFFSCVWLDFVLF